ncbi:MAG: hypothetical protein ACOC9J_01570 [Persicimonas sp.]
MLEESPRDWSGEEGLLSDELIDRYLPEDDGSRRYYVCGPEPMMDIVEAALVGRDIDRRRIMSERFQIA